MEEIPKKILQKFLKGIFLLIPLIGIFLLISYFNPPKNTIFTFPIHEKGKTPPNETGTSIEKIEPYEIKGLVLSTKTYGDQNGDIAPVDLALAWGKLANPNLAKLIQTKQAHRFYYWTLPPNTPLSIGEVISQSANIHMVANDLETQNQLLTLQRGDLIYLKGYLVNIHRNNKTWRTSTSRTDTGTGACEIFLPQIISVLQKDLL